MSSLAAPHLKTSVLEVASKLNENWTVMHDSFGHDPLICRPGFTTFAMRTHVFRWSFVSISAANPTSLEDCGRNDNLSNTVVVCSAERGASCANDEEAKPQHHYIRDDNIGLGTCRVLPHATTDNTPHEARRQASRTK